jgi:hypothetical protein
VILDRLDLGPREFQDATGWEIKPEGACQGDVCVPLGGGTFQLSNAAGRLGMALVSEPETGIWALGPESIGGKALTTADASDFHLPDLDGNEFHISSLRGLKVLVASWAPY